MRIFLLFLFLIVFSYRLSAGETELGSRKALEQVLNAIQPQFQKEFWYGTVASDDPNSPCGLGIKGSDGTFHSEGLSLFIGDINNDGKDEYILVSRCGGSAATDTILEVFQKSGSVFSSLGFEKVLETNKLDGSKLPMNIDKPFLSKSGVKTVMNFKNPKQKWVWENGKFHQFKSGQ